MIESEIVSDVRLMTGTMWHTYFEDVFRAKRLPVMAEVKLDPWLPTGWSGTADWIAWDDRYKAFVLGDLKTIKGEGIKWVQKDGIKDEHMWQLSAYWYALEAMGIPLVRGFSVFYLPQNVPADAPDVEPLVLTGMPLDRDLVLDTMASRWTVTETYLDAVWASEQHSDDGTPNYLQAQLAPPQERLQRAVWSSQSGVFDVKLAPHWSAAYCPFPDELCSCRAQGVTKIGHYTIDNDYVPRKGYENVVPLVAPTPADLKKRARKEAA